jgi:hypothetical protein
LRSRSYRADPYRNAADEDDISPSGHWRALLAPPLFRRPKDMLSLGVALAAVTVIVVNALFLQTGPHPAPIFANPPRPAASAEATSSATSVLPRPRPAELDRSAAGVPAATSGAAAKPVSAAKPGTVPAAAASDPIAELLEPSSRLMAVQRVLSDFGYGQIKPTGIPGPETRAAIEKFERERKLPVTGQVSERLVRELTVMKGGPL